MTMSASVVSSVDGLYADQPGWDALATELGQPWMLQAWTLAWWRWRRPPRAELRVVIVRRGDDVVAVAPWFVVDADARWPEYRMVGARTFFRTAPLAARGSEQEVATVMARALADAEPRPSRLTFHGIDRCSCWPALLASAWPGPRRAHIGLDHAASVSAPVVGLGGRRFSEWFQSRSSNFRKTMGKKRRRAHAAGLAVRLARDGAEFERDLPALLELHGQRWKPRGGTEAVVAGDAPMLLQAGKALAETANVRLFTLAFGRRRIAALLAVAAGGTVVHHLHGFDPSVGGVSPGLLAILAMIEDACERGEARIDLGPGDQAYKWRFADQDEPLVWTTLIPPGTGSFPAHARFLLQRAESAARVPLRRLPPSARRRIRRALPSRP